MALTLVSYTANNTEAVQGAYRNKYDRLLTNWTSSAISAIASGAIIEVGGAAYRANGEEVVASAATATNVYYVKITPAGQTATATWITDKSGFAWDEDNGGWYDDTEMLLPFSVRSDSGSYTKFPWINIRNGEPDIQVFSTDIGAWNMYSTGGGTGSGTKNITTGLINLQRRCIDIQANIYTDAQTSSKMLYQDGYGWVLNSTGTVQLIAPTGGYFDSSTYNDDTINRGTVTVWYTVEEASLTL